MPFSPKRYSRLRAAEQRAFQRLRAGSPSALPNLRAAYQRAADALALYVARWSTSQVTS